MNKNVLLLKKEFRLSSSVLSYFFILGSAFCMIPNYPCLVGAFFVCLGIFYSFQNAREVNDTLYTVLLPVAKKDVVKAKMLFVATIQIAAFVLFAAFTVLRSFLGNAPPYDSNALMNPGLVMLGYILIVFVLFNGIFVTGFYKTAYKIGKPFIVFTVSAFLFITVTEVLHHIPVLDFLNSADIGHRPVQILILVFCAVAYLLFFFVALKISQNRFDKIDF